MPQIYEGIGGSSRPRIRAKWIPKPKKPPKAIDINVPGYTPDWKSLIEGDPSFQQQKLRLAGLSAQDKATRNAALIQKLIAFGSLPDLSSLDLGDFGIDEATRAAIEANQNPNTSEVARLRRQNETNVQALQDMLAARGMLRSGSLGVGLGQEQERYTGAQTNARSALLDALRGLQTEFAAAERARDEQLYGPEGYAEKTKDTLMESGLYEEKPGTTVKAKKDPLTGLYKDGNGNYYDKNGKPVLDPNKTKGPVFVGRKRRAKRASSGWGA